MSQDGDIKFSDEIQSKLVSVNEKILIKCHEIYTNPKNGLVKIAESLGVKIEVPRKKISIMLLGNHSAGKSTFINWYVEEHVQKTGVAIETQGFTLVTSGRRRESLKGSATLHLYPYLKPLASMDGLIGDELGNVPAFLFCGAIATVSALIAFYLVRLQKRTNLKNGMSDSNDPSRKVPTRLTETGSSYLSQPL